jgi:urea carboxylase
MVGPVLRFHAPVWIALTGAETDATLDGQPVPFWTPIEIAAGSVLRVGTVKAAASRAYLAVSGGIDAPLYLNSAATFLLGGFGGHAGRTLRAGDVLSIAEARTGGPKTLVRKLRPQYSEEWQIAVLCGPHGAPDFFTPSYLETFFATEWCVHFHSDRTGVRLIGPKPGWARTDGGEAGLHPSNLHDNAYAIGTIDFTGDMPIILGPDGPSLGGFVCPATIVNADLWKIGQLRAGDRVRFHRVTQQAAEQMDAAIERMIDQLEEPTSPLPADAGQQPEILRATGDLVVRADGDRYLLIELGPNRLDLELRLRIHALEQGIEQLGLNGVIDITPGIRSLQIHYDTRKLSREALLDAVECCYREGSMRDIEIPARTLHLPLSWDDPSTRDAIQRYVRTVNPHAPWAPSNIEFIRRINGLGSVDEVRRMFFDSSYVVLGLGDVYLGAPVATPIDPRHRLVTTKYNPARTWTPQNAVGIGGAYLCIYGMEGPGGYQFVGRTVQVWNTWRTTKLFEPGSPWLLRFFDQIRFYPVSAEELLELRDAFPYGRYEPRVERNTFKLSEYHRFTESIRNETEIFRKRREAAFAEELERWKTLPPLPELSSQAGPGADDTHMPEGSESVAAPVTASVWRIDVEPGQPVTAGQTVMVLEAMKTEIAVVAPSAGVVDRVLCKPGALITAGQRLAVIQREL